MRIEDQFNKIAEEYDANRRKFIPCFEDLYNNTTAFIASNIKKPKSIVDLGAGTGLLSYFWYKHFPDSQYLLVDIAEDMLEVARRRFQGAENVSCKLFDYKENIEDISADTVISAMSIHHLEQREKRKLFAGIFNCLPAEGLFVNYDQFCAGEEELNNWYDRYWENQLAGSGLTENDIALWKERRKLDMECSVEQEIQMIISAGFRIVKKIYTYQKFSVILAIK